MSNVKFLNPERPIVEMNQESELYKATKKQRAERLAFNLAVKEEFDFQPDFAFRDGMFGLEVGSDSEKKYDAALTKGDWHGYRKFRKSSAEHKKLAALYKEHCKTFVNPFENMDAFGMNNIASLQWAGDHWFIAVRDISQVSASARPVHYETYLRLMRDHVDAEGEINLEKCICGGTFKPTDRSLLVVPPLFEYKCEECGTVSNRTIDGEEVRPR